MIGRSNRLPLFSAFALIGLLAAGVSGQDEVVDPCSQLGPRDEGTRVLRPALADIVLNEEEDLDDLGTLLDASGDVILWSDIGSQEQPGLVGGLLACPNLQVAAILSRLDIDGDGVADNSPDTDGDGLPDNWELGGVETGNAGDRVVFYPAPSAIVPGTPPTPIFTRLAVATSALEADTDGDGLTDFIEVFGLMFIDENRNGILDADEWADFNGDGLPSPGEYPLVADRTTTADPIGGGTLLHDFDGFVFTDPTNPDTDGDGVLDGADKDPLINPRSFGLAENIIIRFDVEGDSDIDRDGLGNGMDMGNDLVPEDGTGGRRFQVIDNPGDLRRLLGLFREDLLKEGIVPESAIEDLIGADWDGNGLWRTTDVRKWSLIIDDPNDPATLPPDLLRLEDGTELYSSQRLNEDDFTADELEARQNARPTEIPGDSLTGVYNSAGYDRYGGRGIGLGWQDVLKPPSETQFMPDRHIWAILYSWRMPGFDIDGDGFVGVPNLSNTAGFSAGEPELIVALAPSGAASSLQLTAAPGGGDLPGSARALDDRIDIGDPETSTPQLNGVIEVGPLADVFRSLGCGAFGLGALFATALGLICPLLWRRR